MDILLFLFLDPFTRLHCEEKAQVACFLAFGMSSKVTKYSDLTVADVAHLPSLAVPSQQHNSPLASGSTVDLPQLLFGGFFLLLGP